MLKFAALAASPVPSRRKYRCYSPTTLTNAYIDVLENKISVCKAAKKYSVPEQTLRDRVNGRIDTYSVKSGASPIFDQEEESRLASHIMEMAAIGYGYTRSQVIQLGSEYAIHLDRRDRNHPLSVRWLYGLLVRWPDLKVRKAKSLTELRAKATSEECVNNYFNELDKIMTKYDLKSKPERIYNVDEKGINQSHSPPFVVGAADAVPYEIASERSSTVTILGCGNALGCQIPPYFVFPGVRMRSELLDGCTTGADGTVSESGWSNSVIFQDYVKRHFLRYATGASADQPLLLLYDGHRSHISPCLIDWAKENHVILFVLPAHTSHVLQPMDVGCFGPFAKIYSTECHKFQRSHSGTINKYNICSVARRAYVAALSPLNLQSAFRRSGIYPFSPQVIDRSVFAPAAFIHSSKPKLDSSEVQKTAHMPTSDTTEKSMTDRPDRSHNDDSDDIADGSCVSDITDRSSAFFTDRLPIITKKITKPRRSINKIVGGKAITESEIASQVHDYVSQSAKPQKKVVSSSKKRPSSISKHRKPRTATNTVSIIEPLPSGIYISDSDRSDTEDTPIEDDEKCCVCNRFQPAELAHCASIVFTLWGQCMHGNCKHWVHLKYCCPVRVLRTHDTFYCPCHGLPCKPTEE